ncbi:MAG: HD domain-containing protein [Polyangiaceae bacterium]|nr:HD domain-containing protein [Polyangiaceae bacterium]
MVTPPVRPDSEQRLRGPIRPVPPDALPDISPVLFRELDHRITTPLLEREALPGDFLVRETRTGERILVFRGQPYALNLTLFRSQSDRWPHVTGSGVFVVSNGAGVAVNTVDELAKSVPVAGMIDLKRDFSAAKILAALQMVRAARPQTDVIAVNIISGTALASETVAAVEAFFGEEDEPTAMVLRFEGPGPGVGDALERLVQKHAEVRRVTSTAALVARIRKLLGSTSHSEVPAPELSGRIDRALSLRARHGVRLDPRLWLTHDRTVEHALGDKRLARIGILGFGRTAQFQTRAMVEEGMRVCWIATPTAAKYRDVDLGGVSVFSSAELAIAQAGDVDLVVNYAPASRVADATRDCIAASQRVRMIAIVAEDMPHDETIKTLDAVDEAHVSCIGPNSPGIMLLDAQAGELDRFKFGNMPAHLFTRGGAMSVVGRSGTVIFDIVDTAARAGVGTRIAWAIGGDRYRGLGMLEALIALEQDAPTEVIVLCGESGGIQEQLAARLIATGLISKPVVAMVTGRTLPAGIQFGHLGAVKLSEADDPQVKEQHLRLAGVVVVDNPTEVVSVVERVSRSGWDLAGRRESALWEYFVESGKQIGLRWQHAHRIAYAIVYGLVGHYRLYAAHERTPAHLLELVNALHELGVEAFTALLGSTIQPGAFVAAFEKSREYLADLLRGIREIGVAGFTELVSDVLSEEAFNAALRATPWAVGDLVNEAHELGIMEVKTLIRKTMGFDQFRQSLTQKPWNTTHAFRSINNMRWWNYVRAYERYSTHLTGDNQLIKASWAKEPWASVKLVRGYDRIPDEGLEQALEDPDARRLFFEKSRTDPQGLLKLGKTAFRLAAATGRAFPEVYRELVARGVPPRPTVNGELKRMGQTDLHRLREEVFSSEAFARARADHPNATAQALAAINDDSDPEQSGVTKICGVFEANRHVLDTPAFELALSRNPWMAIELVRAIGRIDPVDVERIVDSVLSHAVFDNAVSEHQWGTAQAFSKIADLGAPAFLQAQRVIEDVTHDRESFRLGFCKNPRDVLEIVQVVRELGHQALGDFIRDPTTREAFLCRLRTSPRNTAHLLQEVARVGVPAFNTLIDEFLGRRLFSEMLRRHGCILVHTVRRATSVGIADIQRELRAWKQERSEYSITAGSALDVMGTLRQRVLERRFSNLERIIEVTVPDEPTLTTSEGELSGLYRTYPEWAEVIFKLQAGEPLSLAERVDVIRLASGRKRFQALMVPVLVQFMPLAEIRRQISSGIPLVPELKELYGITQGPGHRFDAFYHTLEVLEQLQEVVLPLAFVDDDVRRRTSKRLDSQIDGVRRRDLLMLAATLHDVGKAVGDEGHVERGLAVIPPVLARLGLSPSQAEAVTAIVRNHKPKRLREPGEPWPAFVERGGLDLLHQQFADGGRNPCTVETALLYHADILGRLGDETPDWQVARRQQVTRHVLGRIFESEQYRAAST